MSRLTHVPSRLNRPPPRIIRATDDDGHFKDDPGRRLYKLAAWHSPIQGLRMRVFRRDLFTCQLCGKVEPDTSQLIGDHKTPHRGDRDLFFDEKNVWTLCKPCHDSHKQRDERRSG